MLKPRPKLKDKEFYALRIVKSYVVTATPMKIDPDPVKAMLFSGEYLNKTLWDWQYGFELVPEAKLKALVAPTTHPDAQRQAKGAPTSGRAKVALCAILCSLSLHAGAAPMTRIRGPVRITSWRPLANYFQYSGYTYQAQAQADQPEYIGIVYRPIKYRRLRGAL